MIVGVDIGTESVRFLFFDKEWKEIKETYTTYFPTKEAAEQDPKEIFEAFMRALRKLPKNEDSLYIGLSSVFHSVLALDKKGEPIANLLIWADRRAHQERKILQERFGTRFFYEKTACPLHPMYLPVKILWFKRNFQNAVKFLSIKSYIIYKLTGRIIEEVSLASASGLMNIETKEWDKEILKALDLKEDELPEIVSSYELVEVRDEISKELGFREIFLIPGAGDGVLANLGVNAISTNEAVVTIGTSGAVRVAVKEPVIDKEGISTWCYLLDKESYILGAAINNGGIVLKWLKDMMNFEDYEEIIHEAFKSPLGAEGIIFLPFLNGERSPNWREKYKGVIVGLTTFHKRSHIARSVLEGIAFRIKDIFESIKRVGKIDPERVVATGGFTSAEEWVQLVSDVLGKDIEVTNVKNPSAFGAYIMTLKALKMDWRSFLKENVRTEKTFRFNPEAYEKYSKIYERYKYLYNILADYWEVIE